MVFEAINPAIAVSLIALVTLLIINIFYKILINQDKAAELKERVKFLTKEMNKYSKENPEKSKEFMSEMMSAQRDMFKMNMKPMIISLIIVGLTLQVLAGEFRDINVPVDSGEIAISGIMHSLSVSDNRLSLNGNQCELPCRMPVNGVLWSFSVRGNELNAASIVATLPFSLPFIGTDAWWLVWYIIVSIPLNIIIRAAYGIRI